MGFNSIIESYKMDNNIWHKNLWLKFLLKISSYNLLHYHKMCISI